jgi:hypothetical protein
MKKYDLKDPQDKLLLLLIILAFVFFVLSSIAQSQDYTTRIGNTFFHSDGSFTTKVGSTFFHSNGDTSVRAGSTIFHYGRKSRNYWEDCD